MNHPALKKHAHKLKLQTYGPVLEDVVNDIALVFKAAVPMIKSKSRKDIYVTCRRVYFFATRYLTDAPLKSIGAAINTDHTNVIHHRKKCDFWISKGDEKFTSEWNKYKSESKIWSQYIN